MDGKKNTLFYFFGRLLVTFQSDLDTDVYSRICSLLFLWGEAAEHLEQVHQTEEQLLSVQQLRVC